MYFRIKKELRWDGKQYQKGDIIDISETNPRIEGLKIGGFITYDACAPNPAEPEKQGTPVAQVEKRKKASKSRTALAV